VRVGLAAVLAGHGGLTVLESAASPGDLGQAIEAVEADVIVLALEPGETASLPPQASPDRAGRVPAVVVLGEEPASAWANRVLRSGARGALARTATTDQIVAAVLAAAAGLVVREAGAADTRAAPVNASLSPPKLVPLTPREIEILGLFAEGLGNKTIAARLQISEHTVKSHITSIFAKLEVSTRAEAVASAARLGLIML
jgi:DNA-binding NarL/FixJ family response regulator